jgi:hypothetical protein
VRYKDAVVPVISEAPHSEALWESGDTASWIFNVDAYLHPLSVKFWDWVCKKYKIQPHN